MMYADVYRDSALKQLTDAQVHYREASKILLGLTYAIKEEDFKKWSALHRETTTLINQMSEKLEALTFK